MAYVPAFINVKEVAKRNRQPIFSNQFSQSYQLLRSCHRLRHKSKQKCPRKTLTQLHWEKWEARKAEKDEPPT